MTDHLSPAQPCDTLVADFRPVTVDDRSCPQMTVTTGMLELASGVDALYLSGRAALPQALREQLETTRALADEVRATIPFLLGGEQLQLLPHGFGRYCS